MNKSEQTGKNFIGVSLIIFFSKMLGFVRDIVFASVFGTSILTDVFQTIFSLPALFFSGVGTALSSINIPNLTYYINHAGIEERNRYISYLYARITFWGTLVSIAGIILAPFLARIIAPGIEGKAAQIAVITTRIMMPTFLFVTLTFVTAGVLQVHGRFLWAAAISIPFNLLIIAALLLKGADVVFLSYVTTAGWLLQFLIQLPAIIKEKYRFSFKRSQYPAFNAEGLLGKLLPVLLGNSLLALCLIVDRSFATHLKEGTTSALSFGGNLFITVTSIFIVAMASVAFPRLSRYCIDKDYRNITFFLENIFKVLTFILVPYLIYVVIYHHEIITLIYERGAFTRESTGMTSSAFLFYSFAVVGYVSQEIFNRVYYALKKFTVPMKISVICLALNVLLDLVLLEKGIIAISLSTAFSLTGYALIMGIMVRKEVGTYLRSDFARFSVKLLLPMGLMLAVIVFFKYLGFSDIIFGFILPLIISGFAYVGTAYFMGIIRELNLREAA
ncbi:murein biosynthesis integral membrane protein MurJ [Thermosyntropha sp.]|uniref:murein biosynthesis integral membrane protein MurJ n=1 Tax=Thermosyntropha sp. TaxID=2740820 RepID=UPI00260090B9|nr:murein biosynthesis integral membrane protein MurJ [Thermosyntropha sp.]MBO8159732.1 murein biosynthesis integral membrane protein MurJ [Thermosyntropha sp.]